MVKEKSININQSEVNFVITDFKNELIVNYSGSVPNLFEEGKEFNVKPGCPNLIERIEGALLSYGNDFDNRDNPFEANFDKFIHLDSDVDFLGKENLRNTRKRNN